MFLLRYDWGFLPHKRSARETKASEIREAKVDAVRPAFKQELCRRCSGCPAMRWMR